MKRCPKCGETKPINEWHKNSSSKDGLQGWCKSCRCAAANERRANDPDFAERERELIRKWRSDPVNAERNRKLSREWKREWRSNPANAERSRELTRKWRSDPANAERSRELTRKWAKNNPDIYRESSRRRRAVKNGIDAEKIDLIALFERDGWVCYICGEPVDKDLKWPDPGSASHDHVVPLSKGGTHTYDNVKLAHIWCNLSKGAKLLGDDNESL